MYAVRWGFFESKSFFFFVQILFALAIFHFTLTELMEIDVRSVGIEYDGKHQQNNNRTIGEQTNVLESFDEILVHIHINRFLLPDIIIMGAMGSSHSILSWKV